MEDAGVPHQSDILEETSERQLAYAIHDEYSDTANTIRKRKEREREREMFDGKIIDVVVLFCACLIMFVYIVYHGVLMMYPRLYTMRAFPEQVQGIFHFGKTCILQVSP